VLSQSNLKTVEPISSKSECWHLVTPEFPPDLGGVSDYAAQVAGALRATGDDVHVWCYGPEAEGVKRESDDCWLHRSPTRSVLPALKWLAIEIKQYQGPRRMLVQWVPHGYGWQSMNVPFCLWLWWRSYRGDQVALMVHEAFLRFREGNCRQDVAAAVHRVMTVILLQAAKRVWMSTSSWERLLRPYTLGRRLTFESLPVPSNIPVGRNDGVASLNRRFAAAGKQIAGHFGTHGALTTDLLSQCVPELLRRRPDLVFLMIGSGSDKYGDELRWRYPKLAPRIFAVGRISPEEVSRHLLVCDVLIQPFPDGITTRRTSALAGLAHGRAIVTTNGKLTESFWAGSGSVVLVPADDPHGLVSAVESVLDDSLLNVQLRERGRALYEEQFHIRHVVHKLRQTAGVQEPCFASD
jgi:glycosyltransferase involved in cell wall biosynthesis